MSDQRDNDFRSGKGGNRMRKEKEIREALKEAKGGALEKDATAR